MSAGEGMRPLYFMVPFWGRRYREYFVDLCLPSLLAPNNLPLLRAEDGHRFLMATTREDWEAIEGLPIMERLRAHATPTWIEVDDPQHAAKQEAFAQYNSAISYQTVCQKKLVEAAHQARAYGCLLFPDLLYSDGTVATLLKYAAEGCDLVLCSSLRQKEEAVLEDLRARGLLPAAERLSQTAQALTITPRLMADLFVRHLHPEMWIFEEDAPFPIPYVMPSPFHYWRMPDERGMVLHTFQGVPVLMNFAAVGEKHAECLERNMFEYVYINENFAHSDRIRVIQDSDELGWVSLTPEAVNWSPPQGRDPHRAYWLERYDRLCNIRESMWDIAGRHRDALRRDLFRLPIRWHTTELNEAWMKEEQRIGRLIDYAVGDYYRLGKPPHRERFPYRFNFDPRTLLSITSPTVRMAAKLRLIRARNRIILLLDPFWRAIGRAIHAAQVVARRMGLLLCGDRAAVKWWGWRVRKLMSGLTGQRFEEPRPPAPE